MLQAHVRDTRAALSNGCMVEGLVLSFSLGTNVWPKVLKRMNGYEGSKRQRERKRKKTTSHPIFLPVYDFCRTPTVVGGRDLESLS